jgi:hypothetical protein
VRKRCAAPRPLRIKTPAAERLAAPPPATRSEKPREIRALPRPGGWVPDAPSPKRRRPRSVAALRQTSPARALRRLLAKRQSKFSGIPKGTAASTQAPASDMFRTERSIARRTLVKAIARPSGHSVCDPCADTAQRSLERQIETKTSAPSRAPSFRRRNNRQRKKTPTVFRSLPGVREPAPEFTFSRRSGVRPASRSAKNPITRSGRPLALVS